MAREMSAKHSADVTIISADDKCKIPVGTHSVSRMVHLKKLFCEGQNPDLVDHDVRSMCASNLGLQSSYDYIGDEARKYMKEKVAEMDPFKSTRPKVTLHNKSRGMSPFSCMTKDRIEQFAKRNKKNYEKNHPVKELLSSG